MAKKTVIVEVTISVAMELDENADVEDAVNELDYNVSGAEDAKVIDTEMIDYTIKG